jgi:hypothetical protein
MLYLRGMMCSEYSAWVYGVVHAVPAGHDGLGVRRGSLFQAVLCGECGEEEVSVESVVRRR